MRQPLAIRKKTLGSSEENLWQNGRKPHTIVGEKTLGSLEDWIPAAQGEPREGAMMVVIHTNGDSTTTVRSSSTNSDKVQSYMQLYVYIYIYIIHTYTHLSLSIYIYIYIHTNDNDDSNNNNDTNNNHDDNHDCNNSNSSGRKGAPRRPTRGHGAEVWEASPLAI